MKTPFKLLDAFELKDHANFFGRSDEIKREYRDALRTRLMMIYGLSGTGKTSLIKCGLASKFDAGDWFPLYVRPGDNINASLQEAIAGALDDEDVSGDLIDDIKELTAVKLRPLYIIFDQFEEFFTLKGNTREVQEQFMHTLRAILDTKIRCRVIMILREEYIAQLYPFESIVPELFNYRFRVERMNIEKVKEVIRSSFNKFNIHVEEPVEDNLDLMVRNIAGGDGIIDLPYLQIYLDTLYQQDYRDTYGEEGTSEKLPRLDITKDEIQKLGQIEDVLSGFLDQKMRTYYRYLRKKYEGFPQKGIGRVLDQMVTEKGTKKPINYRIKDELYIPEFSSKLIERIDKNALSELIAGLSDDRIVRINPDTIELAHDSLAAIIADRRTDKEKQLIFQFRRIQNAYDEYIATDKNVKQLLTKEQLFVISPFLKDLNLKDKFDEFVGLSRENVEREKELVRARRQKEIDDRDAVIDAQKNAFVEKEKAEEARNEALEQRALATEEREKAILAKNEALVQRKRAKVWGWIAAVILLICVAIVSYFWKESVKLQKEYQGVAEEFAPNLDLQTFKNKTEELKARVKSSDAIVNNPDSKIDIKVLPGSFNTYSSRTATEYRASPQDTFLKGDVVWFFARFVVSEPVSVYVKYVKVGADPNLMSVETDARVVNNPRGFRFFYGRGVSEPGDYQIMFFVEDESKPFDSTHFYVRQ